MFGFCVVFTLLAPHTPPIMIYDIWLSQIYDFCRTSLHRYLTGCSLLFVNISIHISMINREVQGNILRLGIQLTSIYQYNICAFKHLSSETQISLSPLCSGVFNFRVSSACFDKTQISSVTANFIALQALRCEDEKHTQ